MLGTEAFRNCTSLNEIRIPNNVNTIGSMAFSGCSSLRLVYLCSGVATIDEYAFAGCDNLADVYYTGSEEQWEAISIGAENESLTNAFIFCNYVENPEFVNGLSFNGHYYWIFETGLSWDEAQAYCESLGGHLATITSAEEQQMLAGMNVYDWNLWIGGYQNGESWEWITGESWDYSNWMEGEPNCNDPAGNNAAKLWPEQWDDCARTDGFAFICEWDNETAVPEELPEPEVGEGTEPDSEFVNGLNYNGHYYWMFSTNVSWETAKAHCESLGGHLVTITSAEEQAAISAWNCGDMSLWIGASCDGDYNWSWVTGESWDYTNWLEGEPSGGSEWCGAVWPHTWNDMESGNLMEQSGFICEWEDETAVPEELPTPDSEEEEPEPDVEFVNGLSFNGHYYWIFETGLSWDEAQAYCESLGGHLATITSAEEQQMLAGMNVYDWNLWIGGYQNGESWEWITGESWDYSNWMEGEPNCNDPAGNNAAKLWPEQWDDCARTDGFAFICEWDNETAVPEELPEPEVGEGTEPDVEFVNGLSFNGHYYWIIEIGLSWDEAQAYCESLGGHLATITSFVERDAIANMNNQNWFIWLGGYQNGESWEWVTGEEWSYSDWMDGEPNGDDPNGNNALCVWPTQWNDYGRNESLIFLCEWDDETTVPDCIHTYESVVTDPTCSEQGYTTHTCIYCGDSYVDNYVEATGHYYGFTEEIVDREPTCDVPGEMTLVLHCGDCGEGYGANGRNIDPLRHNYEGGVCTVCQAEIILSGSCGDDLTWSYDQESCILTIDGTGEMYDYLYFGYFYGCGTYTPWFTFTNEIVSVVIGPNVTYVGREAFYGCETLNNIYIQSADIVSQLTDKYACNELLTIPSNVYIASDIASVPEYITENLEYFGEESLYDVMYSQYHQHRYSILDMVSNTCESEGYIDWACPCGAEYREILDCHNYETIEHVDPTCTQDGHAIIQCSACGDTIVESFPALEHAYENGTCVHCGTEQPNMCGDELYWSFDAETGVLRIDGVGEMCNYGEYGNGENTPWYAFADQILNIEIGDEVTSIGFSAFQDCTSVQCVSIPANIQLVGALAFANCTSLTDIHWYGKDMLGIYNHVFDGCTSLQNVYLHTEEMTQWGINLYTHSGMYPYIQYVFVESHITEVNEYLSKGFVCMDALETVEVDGISYVKYTKGEHNYEITEQAPTCTERGIATYVCNDCGYTYEKSLAPTGHSLNSEYICDVCGEVFYYLVNGDLTLENLTLGEDGVYYTTEGYACVIAVNAPAYHFGGWTLADYVEQYGDSFFSLTYWDQLMAVTNEDGYAPLTEETLAWILDVITGNPAWNEDETYLRYYIGFYVPHETVCEHIYESVVTDPTYTEQGYTTHICTICGDSYVDSYVDCLVRDGWIEEDGKWYYYVDGIMQTGWEKIGGKWYYMDAEGVMQTGWLKDGGKWYYLDSAMVTGWKQIGGHWYYFNSNGVMQSGWLQLGGKWYYLDNTMATGWKQINSKWYYFNSNGVMQSGWLQQGGKWYYLDNTMATGWKQIDGKWYYFSSSGVMQSGWLQLSGKWYYLDNTMVTGWKQINSKWYYFASNGTMQTGWVKVGNSWFYMNSSGAMQTGWLKLGSNWYYLKSNGAMATGTLTIDGKVYYFNSNGVWIP